MSITPLSFPPKILAAPLAAAGDRLILPDLYHWDYSSSAASLTSGEVGTVIYATLFDFAKTKMEIVELDASTLSVATTTGILINKRALSFMGGLTASAETAFDWTPNETYVLLGSNPPQLYTDLVDLNEAQTISAVKTFTASPIVPTPTTDYQTATKKYADDLTYAGAPDADEATKGIFEAATLAEVAAGDDTGSTTAPTAVRPSKLAAVIQSGSYLYANSADVSDTYTITMTPTLTAYTTGQMFMVKFDTANTAAATLNIDSLGAKDIKKYVAGAVAAIETGDIVADQIVLLGYDGTQFVMMNSGATTLTTAIATEAATFFGSTNITGAEAEDLTDGGSTVLHHHTLPDTFELATGFLQSYLDLPDSTSVAGGGAINSYGIISHYDAGAAALGTGSYAHSKISDFIGASKDSTLTFWAKFAQSGGSAVAVSSIGLFQELTDVMDVDTAASNGFVRLAYEGGALEFQATDNANAARTAEAVAGITATDWNLYKIAFNPGTDAKLYVNGTLKNTISTNLPTNAMVYIAAGAQGDNGTATTADTYTSKIAVSLEA